MVHGRRGKRGFLTDSIKVKPMRERLKQYSKPIMCVILGIAMLAISVNAMFLATQFEISTETTSTSGDTTITVFTDASVIHLILLIVCGISCGIVAVALFIIALKFYVNNEGLVKKGSCKKSLPSF